MPIVNSMCHDSLMLIAGGPAAANNGPEAEKVSRFWPPTCPSPCGYCCITANLAELTRSPASRP